MLVTKTTPMSIYTNVQTQCTFYVSPMKIAQCSRASANKYILSDKILATTTSKIQNMIQ